MAAMQPIRYESTGGLEIPAYLTLPKGVPPKDLPLIVLPHGGPWGRDGWGFAGMAQFLANRGYAVLMPNFRGSTGYGKKFLNLGNNQWGQTMQDDLTWGVKHLVAKGIADPKRVGIMGGSYGGYATLAGLAFTPDVYAAGVDIVGPSNLLTLLTSIPPYWESFRTILYKRTGDPNTPEGKEQLRKQSPLFSANKIKAPLLVVQGANDPRVNKAESDQIVIALRDRGFPVEYLVAPDEGHGFARPVNSMAMFAAAEKFLAKHIGGRYQETMTPEVATRLKEITVDPKTVVLAKKVDSASVGLPKVAAPLNAGTYRYLTNIQAGERSIRMDTTTEIRRDGEVWRITDKAKTPMGEMTSETVLDGNSLELRKQTFTQGPMGANLEVKGTKLVGVLRMPGGEKPVNVDTGGPLFTDAAGSSHVISALPLADGYTATFRNFDIQKQQSKLMQLKVAGAESIQVPAGTFDAWKIEVTSADGGNDKMTLWVAKEARKPVRAVATMPQMGGATMTVELQ
jgi:dienelactone hydrolase